MLHVFTHFATKTEQELRDYLHNYMLCRPDWLEQVSAEVLKARNISVEDYVDSVTTPGIAIDLLAVFLLARQYRIHFGVFMHSKLWLSCKEDSPEKCHFFLVCRGETSFAETCKIGEADLYLDSLIKETASGHMPSHADESKLGTVSQDEEDTELEVQEVLNLSIKPKVPKSEFKKETDKISAVSVSIVPKKEGHRYKKALKLLLKAKKENVSRAVKLEKAQMISQYIASNVFNPAQVAARAVERNRSWIQVECCLCQKHCRSKREYIRHRQEDHPGVKFKCQYCDKEYASMNGVYKHEKTHQASLYCGICARIFPFQHQLTKHLATHDETLQVSCPTCAKMFASKKTMERHAQGHLNLEFPCSTCGKVFNTKEKTQRHWRGAHGEGYTTLCQKETYQWPGKRQRHQLACDDCKKIQAERKNKKYAAQ